MSKSSAEFDLDRVEDKMKKIEKELNELFYNAQISTGEQKHNYDKTGKSYQKYVLYILNSGDNVQLVCINWSKEIEKTGHTDELFLTMGLKEYADFVEYRAYN